MACVELSQDEAELVSSLLLGVVVIHLQEEHPNMVPVRLALMQAAEQSAYHAAHSVVKKIGLAAVGELERRCRNATQYSGGPLQNAYVSINDAMTREEAKAARVAKAGEN